MMSSHMRRGSSPAGSQCSTASSRHTQNLIASTQARINSLRNLQENTHDASGFSSLYQAIIDDYTSGRITYREGQGYLYSMGGLIAGPLPKAELRGEAIKRTLSGNYDIHLEWCSEEPIAEVMEDYNGRF
ncbi:hypothetical protein TWF694_010587 [Orbilia ellipsospora]|uniref:Uncharacterized protein n=1 Tax=Orbilia ellipsospora TaxID=2528407 RepID=A0AAV9XBG8_9PEZI